MTQIDFVSLFAGIGGFDLGLERAGMRCVGQVEIDLFCQAVLSRHWPNVKRVGDIHDVTKSTFQPVKLICAGTPCQPASSAGKRAGADDDRWLWPETLRVSFEYMPDWLLFENPYGIFTLNNGLEFEKIIIAMENQGYSVQPILIPACALGAPHRRDRISILAHLDKGVPSSEPGEQQEEWAKIIYGRSAVHADNNQVRCEKGSGNARGEGGSIADRNYSQRCYWWETEPAVGRMVRRFSSKLDERRIECLGNSANPQTIETIGRAIMKAEECARGTRGRAGEHHATAQGEKAAQA